MKKEFITMYQRPPLYFPEPGSHEYLFFLEAGKVSNTFILPEYFSFENNIFNPEELFTQSKKTLKRLVNLSSTKEFKNTLVIGGSLILRQNQFLYNAAPIIYNGKVLSYYFKKTLFEKEKYFLTHGKENLIITHPLTGKKIGILICADVLDNQNFKSYRNIDYIAIPVASPFRSEDTPEIQRERDKSIFLAASRETNSLIFKCCLAAPEIEDSGNIQKKVQGRSLISDPDEIKIRVPHIRWRGLIFYSELDQAVKLQEY